MGTSFLSFPSRPLAVDGIDDKSSAWGDSFLPLVLKRSPPRPVYDLGTRVRVNHVLATSFVSICTWMRFLTISTNSLSDREHSEADDDQYGATCNVDNYRPRVIERPKSSNEDQ